jgi:hypothetical protein
MRCTDAMALEQKPFLLRVAVNSPLHSGSSLTE